MEKEINKHIIQVPKGIRFISEWKDSEIESISNPYILNKTITGCGFTEYCITNSSDLILLSPRRILLENKEDQHPGELLYVRNEYDKFVNYEKDFTVDKPELDKEEDKGSEDEKTREAYILSLKKQIRDFYVSRLVSKTPCKILVTYDSFRHVKEALSDVIGNFKVVVDEFQSILVDAKFKSTAELELLYHLQGIKNLCFVSATPLLDKYILALDEFKDLPYYELDWKTADPGRVKQPNIQSKETQRLSREVDRIIQSYLNSNFEVYRGQRVKDSEAVGNEIKSTEAVLYFNSVKGICNAIKRNGLTFDQCNILCARTEGNEKKLRKAFTRRKKEGTCIGTVPKKGEPHKMFTFCTRTVYLGADFYSTCARTFVFSDANVDSLSVDISIDLEQIIGRQRLKENPWKDYAELYYKPINKEKDPDFFTKYLEKKRTSTNNLLLAYDSAPELVLGDLAESYTIVAKAANYKSNWVAVNQHAGSKPQPVFNNLMMFSEIRTFEIQQIDYKDRFSVFNKIEESYNLIKSQTDSYISKFDSLTLFTEKMHYFLSLENIPEFQEILSLVPLNYKTYYLSLGAGTIRSLNCQKSLLEKEIEKRKQDYQIKVTTLKDSVTSEFEIGKNYFKKDIKKKLGEIYARLGYSKTPKATDLEEFFEIKRTNSRVSGIRTEGFTIISLK